MDSATKVNPPVRTNNEEAIDARMSALLPPLSVVKHLHECSIKEEASRVLKNRALLAYTASTNTFHDKELFRFMPSQINWDDVTCEQKRHTFKDLGNGAFSADLLFFLDENAGRLDENTHRGATQDMCNVEVQEKVVAALEEVLNSRSPLQLFIMAAYTSAQVIYVPKNVHLTNYLLTGQGSAEFVLLIINEGASISFLDTYTSLKGIHMRALVGLVGRGGRVLGVQDHHHSAETFALHIETWLIATGSSVTTLAGTTGGKQTWSFKDFSLTGENASIEHLTLTALQENEHSALVTRQKHQAESTKSSVHVKALLLNQSRSFYRGTITMSASAIQSEADQQQRALILSPLARTCAIPSLEVATHDVRCSHGSAVGRFNADELWYLHARGFDMPTAQALLIDGFYNNHPLIREHAPLVSSLLTRIQKQNVL